LTQTLIISKEIFRWRGESYQSLNKYIQATFDFQKAIDLSSTEVFLFSVLSP